MGATGDSDWPGWHGGDVTTVHRRAEDAGLEFEDVSNLTTLEVIRASFRLYGSIFAILFFIYLIGRRRYRKAFDILDSVDGLRTPLSREYHGVLSWMWGVFQPSDDELFDHCGMDAIVFVRILRFGLHVALVGIFNSVYLIPVYATAGGGNTELESVTLGNIPEGKHSLIVATVASYIVFGSAMFLLFKEFEWFTKHRHRFLSRARPDNYTVFVKHIPPHFRTDDALLEYFRKVFSHDAVIDARIALDTPLLEKSVAEREQVVAKLEHAINVLNVKGERPRHRKTQLEKRCCAKAGGETVDSITEWTAEMDDLNDRISKTIECITAENRMDGPTFQPDLEAALRSSGLCQSVQKRPNSLDMGTGCSISLCEDASISGDNAVATTTATGGRAVTPFASVPMSQNKLESQDILEKSESNFDNEDNSSADQCKFQREKKKLIDFGVIGDTAKQKLRETASRTANAAKSAADAAAAVVIGDEDGKPLDAGFVSFSSLKAKASALQMIHHPTPFTMNVLEAPLPKDVFWGNVGLSHSSQQIGMVVGNVLTALLCIFWTIPVSFLTALGEVGKLTEMLPFLAGWIEKAPWLEMFLSQLKPLLLVLIVAMLPIILTAFAKKEGHIAETTLQASLFTKLSIFLLIQIFFVQMISGSVLSQIQNMLKDPLSIISLLAEALPQQAQSFIQYVVVQTFLNLGFEILRVGPIVTAWFRGKFGPNLTEKERQTAWMGLSPLCKPPEFDFADVQANLILYYMILFVYSVLSPIVSFLMAFAFLLLSMCYRNQLIYIYPTSNDTGGQLFTRFANLVMVCIIIAEITMFGVVSLKKGTLAAPLIIPLIIGTVMFNMYLKQQHYHVTQHLPSIKCVEEDLKNMGELDFNFVKGKYVQPALQMKYLQPDNMPTETIRRESQFFFTPEHSQIEVIDESSNA